MKINVNKARQLRKQKAWYYLPTPHDPHVTVIQDGGDGNNGVVSIPARKLLKELLLTCPRGK